jgi:hypothetical protein
MGRSLSTILSEMFDQALIRATKSSEYSFLHCNAHLERISGAGGRTIDLESVLGRRSPDKAHVFMPSQRSENSDHF